MNTLLKVLLGLVSILVLAYVGFLDVSMKIKDDLLAKAKTKLIEKGIVDVSAKVEGEGLGISRTLILTGTIGNEKERMQVASLLEEIDGVSSVNNQIVVKPREYTVQPIVKITPIKTILPVVLVPVKVVEVKKETAVVVEETLNPVVLTKEIKEENLSIPKVVTPVGLVNEMKMEAPVIPATVPVVPEVKEEVFSLSVVPTVATVKESNITVLSNKIPAVPVVSTSTIEVPTPIKVISVPLAVEAEKTENEGVK